MNLHDLIRSTKDCIPKAAQDIIDTNVKLAAKAVKGGVLSRTQVLPAIRKELDKEMMILLTSESSSTLTDEIRKQTALELCIKIQWLFDETLLEMIDAAI